MPTDTPFQWPESAKVGNGSGRYDQPGDFAGRWVSQSESCEALEIRSDGRFRWLNAHRDKRVLCTVEGTITLTADGPQWWSSPIEYERQLATQPDACGAVPHLIFHEPPLKGAPAVLFSSPDSFVLAFPSQLPGSSNRLRKRRFRRVGSVANVVRDDRLASLQVGSYLVTTNDGQVAELVVGPNPTDPKPRARKSYSLKWHRGQTETGHVTCLPDKDNLCTRYRFMPAGAPQRDMAAVQVGRVIQLFNAPDPSVAWNGRNDGWWLSPLQML